jgi:hypothetical protein
MKDFGFSWFLFSCDSAKRATTTLRAFYRTKADMPARANEASKGDTTARAKTFHGKMGIL